MNSPNVVVLSSTPDRQPSRTPAHTGHNQDIQDKPIEQPPQLSSPISLAPPSELFKAGTASTSKFFNNNAIVTPQKRRKPSIVKAGNDVSTPLCERENIPQDKPKGRNRKNPGKKTQTNTNANTDTADVNTTKRAPRKPRSRKTSEDNNNKESNNQKLTGKVAKPGDTASQDSGKVVETMPPTPPVGPDAGKEVDCDWENEGLQLEGAMKRRLDWTPPKDTIPKEEVVELDDHSDMEGNTRQSAQRNFENMLFGYNFSGDGSSRQVFRQKKENAGPTKKRRIELVGPGAFPAYRTDSAKSKKSANDNENHSRKKPRKQQKKMTTITAHSTANHVSNDIENPGKEDPVVEDLTIEDTINSRLQRSKKRSSTDHTVLSPEAAVRNFQDQDLMFGTCSQLERDDSPTTLKETQMAIHASESSMPTERNHTPGRTVSRFAGSRNLWSVAARNQDGFMVQTEVVNLVDSPDVNKITPIADDSGHKTEETPQRDSWLEIDEQPEQPVTLIDDKEASNSKETSAGSEANAQTTTSQHLTTESRNPEPQGQRGEPPLQMPRYAGFTDYELSKEISAYGFKAIRNRKKMIELLQKCWESKHGKSINPTNNTGEQSEIPRRTAKPIQSGSNPVEQGRTKRAPEANGRKVREITPTPTPSAQNNAIGQINPPQTPSPKPTTHCQDIEEIDDSEEELTPSPTRLQDLYNNNQNPNELNTLPTTTNPIPIPSSPISISPPRSQQRPRAGNPFQPHPLRPRFPSTAEIPPSPSPEAEAEAEIEIEAETEFENSPDLAAQITRAVHAQPRPRPRPPQSSSSSSSSSSNEQLTWYEKILMYDPIVLEEFAAWLNTTGLGLVGEDREVSAGFVRGWCEKRGVCCCWGTECGEGWKKRRGKGKGVH